MASQQQVDDLYERVIEKDATIAELRADVLKFQEAYIDVTVKLATAIEDRRVLGDLANDAVSGLRYLEQTFGRAPGIGWDRVYQKQDDASKALGRAQ